MRTHTDACHARQCVDTRGRLTTRFSPGWEPRRAGTPYSYHCSRWGSCDRCSSRSVARPTRWRTPQAGTGSTPRRRPNNDPSRTSCTTASSSRTCTFRRARTLAPSGSAFGSRSHAPPRYRRAPCLARVISPSSGGGSRCRAHGIPARWQYKLRRPAHDCKAFYGKCGVGER